MPKKNNQGNKRNWDWGAWSWLLVASVYVGLVASTLGWGLPSEGRVFSYFMDEWHSMTAIRSVYRFGTTMVEGSAFGTLLFYLLSGAYLAPWVAVGYLDPGQLVNEISEGWMYQRVLVVLRLSTLVWGVAGVGMVYWILRRWFGTKRVEAVALLAWSPVWLVTSGYFKYDVALVAGIAAVVAGLLWFGDKPTARRYGWVGVLVGLAGAIKISGLPLFVVYAATFWIFVRERSRWKEWVAGVGIAGMVFGAAGVPDLILGIGNYKEVIVANLVSNPVRGEHYLVPWWWEGVSWGVHFVTEWGVLALAMAAGVIVGVKSILGGKLTPTMQKRVGLILVGLAVMGLSLQPLHLSGLANRAMVLLPFATILAGWGWEKWAGRRWKWGAGLLVVLIQGYWGVSWLGVKWREDPRAEASRWVEERIGAGSTIGIEESPIYQWLPDNLWLEYAGMVYGGKPQSHYQYQILSGEMALPEWVVVSNYDLAEMEKSSNEKVLLRRLKSEGYLEEARFAPNIPQAQVYDWLWKRGMIIKPKLVATPRVIGVFRRE